ncbi:MAG: uracil-DNA glycosylase [Myxococcaceae bacterium]
MSPPRDTLQLLAAEITACRRCKRLVRWREEVAATKRRAYRDQTYWGKAVPGFGDPRAKLFIVGLAPAAHGANRTGRMFTGDRSGDFLYAGLHRAGFANQPHSTHATDGLTLRGAYITNTLRCAPPDNLPTPKEIKSCSDFFSRELELLKPTVVLALGAIGWNAVLNAFNHASPRPKFAHGALVQTENGPTLLGCYHVSQQNTQTGRLTPKMFDDVMATARQLLSR